MTLWNNYHLAQNLKDALSTLASAQGKTHSARLVAGGSDLLLDIQQGRHAPIDTLVDVSAIPELNLIEIRQGQLFIERQYRLTGSSPTPLSKSMLKPCMRLAA